MAREKMELSVGKALSLADALLKALGRDEGVFKAMAEYEVHRHEMRVGEACEVTLDDLQTSRVPLWVASLDKNGLDELQRDLWNVGRLVYDEMRKLERE